MSELGGLMICGLWGVLMLLAIKAQDVARALRRRELWRSLMAGLCGLASTFESVQSCGTAQRPQSTKAPE